MEKKDLASSVVELIDKIYERFLMRDIFAKVVPGLVLIGSVFFLITGEYERIKELTELSWLFLVGLAWIIAFGIQSVGEFFKILRYHSDSYKSDKEWYKAYNDFLEVSSSDEKSNGERFIVIKEATGNLGITLIVSEVLIFLRLMIDFDQNYNNAILSIVSIFIFLFAILLARIHKKQVEKQCAYIEQVISRH